MLEFIIKEPPQDTSDDKNRGHTIPFHSDMIFQYNKKAINAKFFLSAEALEAQQAKSAKERLDAKKNGGDFDQDESSSPQQMIDIFMTPTSSQDDEDDVDDDDQMMFFEEKEETETGTQQKENEVKDSFTADLAKATGEDSQLKLSKVTVNDNDKEEHKVEGKETEQVQVVEESKTESIDTDAASKTESIQIEEEVKDSSDEDTVVQVFSDTAQL